MDGLASDWETITQKVGAIRRPRDIIRVFGADAEKFLQSQVSQDVMGLTPGESRWTFLLEPKGRVEALLRVWGRHGDSEILLDITAGSGQRVIDRLNRFRIRTKVELETFAWDCVSLRGPASGAAAAAFHSELTAPVDSQPSVGVDLLGPSVVVPEGIPEISEAAFRLLRIEAGWPDMDHEFSPTLDPAPIPGELGGAIVETCVSFTKGCYTGQELVVRTHSRGNNTPRRLRRLQVDNPGAVPIEAVATGAPILVDGEVRGVVTSIAERPGGGWAGLGFVNRSVGDPAVGTLQLEPESSGGRDWLEIRIMSPVDANPRSDDTGSGAGDTTSGDDSVIET